MANVAVRVFRIALGILLNYGLLVSTALIMLLHTVFVLPVALCVPAFERRMQEALQSVWVLMLLGAMSVTADSQLIVTIDEGDAGYEAYRRLAPGYRFAGADGHAARLAAERTSAAPVFSERCAPPSAGPPGVSPRLRVSALSPTNAPAAGHGAAVDDAPALAQRVPDADACDRTPRITQNVHLLDRDSDLIISNHQMYLDWAYIWALMLPLGREGTMKIILKESLARIPIYGWGLRLVNFVLLARSWDVDRGNIGRRLRRLPCPGVPFSLLVFPEGTTLCANGQAATRRYAARTGGRHAVPRFTLLPRVTGTQFALQQLGAHIDGVLDVTVGYSGIGRVSPDGALEAFRVPEDAYRPAGVFFAGEGPAEVHVHVRYHRLTSVPFLPDALLRDTEHVSSRSLAASTEAADSLPGGNGDSISAGSGAPREQRNDAQSASTGSLVHASLPTQHSSSIASCPAPDAETFATTPAFEDWMYARFREKEALMEAFYRDGRFPGVRSVRPSVAPPGAVLGLFVASVLATLFFWALFSLIFAFLFSL